MPGLSPFNDPMTGAQINARLAAVGLTLADDKFTLTGSADATKLGVFELDGLSTGTTRIYTLPNASGTIVLTADLAAYQPLDADLTALAALAATGGMLARTGAGAFAVRTLAGTANELTITNADGVSGAPTFSLPTALTFTGKTVTGGTFNAVALSSSGGLTVSAGTTAVQALTATGITNSSLTSGRIPFASTAGLMADSAALTFSGTALTLGTGATGGLTIAATSGTTLTVSSAGTSAISCAGGATFAATVNAAYTSANAGRNGFLALNSAGTDGLLFGWTSATYTTGGGIGWAQNNSGVVYAPTAFRIGAGVGATAYVEVGTAEFRVGAGLNFAVNATGATALSCAGGIRSTSATAGVGYATGAGGTVTQLTSRTTGVTLNKICGQITTNNASLASGSEAVFTVTNSTVAIGDVPLVAIGSGSVSPDTKVSVKAVGSGSFDILVANLSGGVAETGSIVINFAVHKAVSA